MNNNDMFLILEVDEYTDKWKQASGTTAYDSQEEAEQVAQEKELFDCVLVKYIKFL